MLYNHCAFKYIHLEGEMHSLTNFGHIGWIINQVGFNIKSFRFESF